MSPLGVRLRQTFFFQNAVKQVLYKIALVSDVLEYIEQIYSPLNLANMKKLKTQICPEYRTG